MFAWINRPQIPITTRQSVKTSIVVIRAALLSGGCNRKKLPLLLRRETEGLTAPALCLCLGTDYHTFRKLARDFCL